MLANVLPFNHVVTDADLTLREVRCQSCGENILAILIPTGQQAELIFPPKVECFGDRGHFLSPRAKKEDANAVIVGSGLDYYDAQEYKQAALDKYDGTVVELSQC
jgi:hypothetical protein